jgi:hypothetical protein
MFIVFRLRRFHKSFLSGSVLIGLYCVWILFLKEFSELWPKLDLIFDGGVLGTSSLSKQGSTVVDLSKRGWFTIIRDGRLAVYLKSNIERILNFVNVD